MPFNDQEYQDFVNKYKLNDQIQAAQSQAAYDEATSNIPLAQFAAGMGSALAGRGPQESATYFDNQRKLARDEMTQGQSKQKDMLKAYLDQKALEQKTAKEIEAANTLKAKTDAELRHQKIMEGLANKALDLKGKEFAQKTEQGKTLPSAQAESLGDANASFNALDAANKVFQASGDIAGPIRGRISGLMSTGEIGGRGLKAKSFDAQLKINAQTIGKYLEGGKLTDADIDRYKKMLPNLNDSPEAAQEKTNLLKEMLANKQAAQVEALSQAGYNVGNIKLSPKSAQKISQPSPPTETKVYQGKTYQLVGQNRQDPKSWKVVGQ